MLDLMKIQKGGLDGPPATGGVVCTPAPSRPGLETEDEAVPTTPLDDLAPLKPDLKHAAADESDGDSDSLASTSSSASDVNDETAPAATGAGDFIDGPVLRNRRSHVVHRCSNVEGKTLCNRLTTTDTFELLAEGCSTLNARCSRCFKGQVLTTAAAMAEALDVAKAKRFIKRI